MEKKKFNQAKYITEYDKEHYKQFKVKLKIKEKEELDELLEKENLTQAQFLRNAISDFKEDLKMKEKIEKIDNLIEKIINSAIENYTSDFDENNGMSIEDWENGYKNTIRTYNGEIKKYISKNDFESLYDNFKYDLNKATDEQLDFILNYLEEEKQYVEYEDLDRELYILEEIQDEINEKNN